MISFVIPTLNEEKVLDRTLSSLAGYKGEHEIIVSDGGSKDRTVLIAKKYTNKVVEYSGKERQTIAMGRNDGAAQALGDILVFLDADVTFREPEQFFSKVLTFFKSNENAVALAVPFRVYPEEESFADKIMFYVMSYWYHFCNTYLGFGLAAGECIIVRTSAFQKIGGFDPKLVAAEDQDLVHRLGKVGTARFDRFLYVYHSGRRAHTIGWPRLVFTWVSNSISQFLFGRSLSKEWKEVR